MAEVNCELLVHNESYEAVCAKLYNTMSFVPYNCHNNIPGSKVLAPDYNACSVFLWGFSASVRGVYKIQDIIILCTFLISTGVAPSTEESQRHLLPGSKAKGSQRKPCCMHLLPVCVDGGKLIVAKQQAL
jgi:hypothetical protein